MPILSKRNRGRPRKTSLVHLPTMIWYQAVERALGFSSAYKVEVFLEPTKVRRNNDGISRNNRWDFYRDGKRDPDDVAGGAIEIAEAAAPGTARWIRSPIWQALQGRVTDKNEISAHLKSVPNIKATLFVEREAICIEVDGVTIGGPTYELVLENVDHCIDLNGLDLLEAIILLFEMATLSNSAALTARTLDLYDNASRKISKIPEIRRDLPQLLGVIDDRYTASVNIHNDAIFPPWFVRLPDLLEVYFDIDAMREESLKQP
jgi:hypothetical protein